MIVGGGEAGLSAALCAARMNRTVAVVDRGVEASRDQWARKYLNYPGFPDGISARALRELGEKQAALYGVERIRDELESLRESESGFVVEGRDGLYRAGAVILAYGVMDGRPEVENAADFEGYDLHYCLLCDGYEMRGSRVAVIGNADSAVAEAGIMTDDFGCEAMICLDGKEPEFTEDGERQLRERSIDVRPEKISRFVGEPRTQGGLEGLEVEGGEVLPVQHALAALGTEVNTKLAEDLSVELDGGYVAVDARCATNVPLVYAAGDITGGFNQAIVAAGQGAVAAIAACTDLRNNRQTAKTAT
ncbi:MAG: NAD(P)/FAD-dependent oxidoreductase [Actinomycetota bacterium]|nr:NAD(P)/FAD-dependent oxidoreductase [Actinomycetota bacterium]